MAIIERLACTRIPSVPVAGSLATSRNQYQGFRLHSMITAVQSSAGNLGSNGSTPTRRLSKSASGNKQFFTPCFFSRLQNRMNEVFVVWKSAIAPG